MKRRWQVRLAERALLDFTDIVDWTARYFGLRQARSYAATLRRALKALDVGPGLPDLCYRPELGQDLATLHVARQGRIDFGLLSWG